MEFSARPDSSLSNSDSHFSRNADFGSQYSEFLNSGSFLDQYADMIGVPRPNSPQFSETVYPDVVRTQPTPSTSGGSTPSGGAGTGVEFGSMNVREDSLTPYTDATQCKKKAKHVKRPMNPFMVFAQRKRRVINERTPGMHNAVVSKILGTKWRTLTAEEKQPFIEESERLRKLHMEEYPDYKFKPCKKTKPAAKPVKTDSGRVSKPAPKANGARSKGMNSSRGQSAAVAEPVISSVQTDLQEDLFATPPATTSFETDISFDCEDMLSNTANRFLMDTDLFTLYLNVKAGTV